MAESRPTMAVVTRAAEKTRMFSRMIGPAMVSIFFLTDCIKIRFPKTGYPRMIARFGHVFNIRRVFFTLDLPESSDIQSL